MTEAAKTPATALSAREVAAAFLAAKSASSRKAMRDLTEARASASKKLRWTRLLSAMDANDAVRLNFYASSGEEKRVAGAALTAATKPAAKAKPAAKPVAKPAAPAAKAKAAPKNDPIAEAAALLGIDPSKMAAFAKLIALAK